MSRIVFALLVLLASFSSVARDYLLSSGATSADLPTCSSNNWLQSVSGGIRTYHCANGSVSLSSGDNITATSQAILSADAGFSLAGGNTIGSPTAVVDLVSSYGATSWQGSNNHLFGSYQATNTPVTFNNVNVQGSITTGGAIVVQGGSVGGDVRSSKHGTTLENTSVQGAVFANGNIIIDNSSVSGSIETPNNSLTVTDSTITGSLTANGNIMVTRANVSGNITTPNNSVTLNDANVIGSVSANGNVVIDNTSVTGNLTSTNNQVTLNNGSYVLGDVTAGQPSWGIVNINGGSVVEGNCLYNTVPANACGASVLPSAVALYHLEEQVWDGSANEVLDASGNGLHGRAVNGAVTAIATPALPTLNNLGTCGYGVFNKSSNQYLEVPHSQLFNLEETLTVSAWIHPNDYPNSGLMSIVSKDGNYEFHLDSSGRVYWYWEYRQGNSTQSRVLISNSPIAKNQWSHITIRHNKSGASQRQSIFINGQLNNSSNHNDTLATNNRPLQIGQDQNFAGRAFDGFIDEVQIFSQALSNAQILQLYRQRHPCSSGPILQCFSDSFDSSLSDLWVTSTSKGSFQPGVVNGRLRFTQAVGNQSTSSSYQRLFPARDNLVEVEFDHFAYDGTGADGIAVVLSDARVTPRAGAFGGPLGYGFKLNEPGFSGGWLGIGIDEYGNFSNEGGQGSKPGRRRQSVALRGSGEAETGYRYLAGACNNGNTNINGSCLNPTVDNNNSGDIHRYKIVVDSRVTNQSQVEILRKVGSGNWQTIVGPLNVLDSQFNQAAVPDDFLLSITGSTGGSNNIHEIDNFQVCALDSRPITQQIDHFRIIHTGQGVTCSAESVTVMACKNADCSELFTDPVQATLSPATVSGGGGWVGGNVINFSGGSTTVELRKNQPGSITLGVSGSSPTTKPFATTLCQAGGGWSASHCSITFADSGFVIDVPDFIANSSVTATIKAVKTSDASLQCVPEFANVDKTINFWSRYIAPDISSVVGSPTVSINSVEIGKSQALASPIPMSFNASGEASFTLNYLDAGRMQLNARYQGSGAEDGLEMVGSDQFVSFPKYLQISAQRTSNKDYDNNNINGQCATANTSCDVFSSAGESFNLLVTAYGEGDVVTPNYQHSNMALTHTLVAPVSGQAGTISTSSYQQVPMLGGTNTVAQSVSEVGVFNFTVTPQGPFQSSNAYTIAAANTGNIGRFIPAYFAVSPMTVTLAAACSTGGQPFTYLGQPFGYANNPGLYLQPKSGSGSDTLNYLIGDWWRYDNDWENREYINDINNLTVEKISLNANVIRQPSLGSGVILNDEQLSYQKPIDPMVPFNADFNLHLSINDLRDSDDVCYRTSYSEHCLDYTFENIDQTMPLYWGRLTIEDVFGPETQGLEQPIYVERYTSNGFVRTTEDNCTALPAITGFILQSDDYMVVTGDSAVPPQVLAEHTAGNFAQGKRIVRFSAPGAGVRGVIDTMLNLNTHNLMWLAEPDDEKTLEDQPWQYYFKDSTQGQVQFGLYRGNDRVIWWRETN
ncbi:polymer-forming cytoskeletal protein [Vibrio metschnikovii]|nr:polymer-forming cytoskeletal protein [Vibrio metschnikovii]